MPVREDILTPIPGDNPSGENLEYDPLYDQIKEARREDDDAPQGDWAHARKTADWKLVIQLAGDALATKSKDLQLAAWLTEALLRREGFAGLRAGLELTKALLENFWDTLYPTKEDLDFRAMPIEWIGTRLNQAIKETPLTKSGAFGFFKYKESRAVGYEEEADTSEKQTARQAAIDDHKITAEIFDKAFKETPKDFYQRLVENLDGCLAATQALRELADDKFGDYSPSLVSLRETLEEVRHTANSLYQKKREEAGEFDRPAEPEEVEEPAAEPEPQFVRTTSTSGAVAVPAREPVRKAPAAGLVPADKAEIPARLTAIAKFLREQDEYDPGPYLMLRGYRWGELRRDAPNPSLSLLEAPSTELRTQIKAAMLESEWTKVIEIGEAAMAETCGRGWLDLQRYICTALEGWSAPLISAAIKSELRVLLKDIPDLRRWSMMDDTPTANAETQAWLDQIIAEGGESAARPTSPPPVMEEEEQQQHAATEEAPPDSYELALQAIRQGRSKEAVELLASEAAHQPSGRGRFRRKQQLAEVCIKLGQTAVAQPILEELLAEIDEHKLDEWESAESVAYPLTMLLDCMAKLDGDAAIRQKIYHRICRLDPVQALNCQP
jgi:type VI secretion system protein ImpA